MGVNLTQLDTETSDLDLIIGPTGALDSSVWEVSTKIAGSVHSISDTEPVFSSLRVALDQSILSVDTGSKPIWYKLLGGSVGIEVSFGETTGSNVDFSHFTDGTRDVSVGSVDNEKLNIDHTLTGRDNILLSRQEGRIVVDAGNGKVRDGSLSLSRTKHVDDTDVLCKTL